MKATEIKELLAKDKLTVDELGKLFLTSCLTYETKEKIPLDFEIDDKISLLNPGDAAVFFKRYMGVPSFIDSMMKDYKSVLKSYASILMTYESHIRTFEEGEYAYSALSLQPRILTKRDYEAALAEARAKLEANTYSLMYFVKYEINHHLQKHNNGEDTPYSVHFEKLKTKKISAEHYDLFLWLIQDKYDRCNNYILTNDSTYYDCLVNISNFFNASAAFFKDIDGSLLDACPELCKAIIDDYSDLEGLEYLKGLEPNDKPHPGKSNIPFDYNTLEGSKQLSYFFQGKHYEIIKSEIKFKTAYELNIADTRNKKPELTFNGVSLNFGVAVIEEENISNKMPMNHIKNGTYYYTLPESTMKNMAEGFLNNHKLQNEIVRLKKSLKVAGKLLNAYAHTLDLIADETGIKAYEKLKQDHMDEDLSDLMEHAKFTPRIIERRGFLEFERDTDDLQEKVEEAFDLKFKLKDLSFTDKEQATFKKIYNDYEAEGLENKLRQALGYLKGLAKK